MAQLPDPALGDMICVALRRQVEKLGLSIGDEPHWSKLSFVEIVDPYSQEINRVGTWRGGERYGTVTLFPDGRVFAEYQVLQPHPERADHYVESVQIWGSAEKLRGDAVLAEYAR
jgi:hypothetical protein